MSLMAELGEGPPPPKNSISRAPPPRPGFMLPPPNTVSIYDCVAQCSECDNALIFLYYM